MKEAPREGYAFSFTNQVRQHLGNGGCCVPDLQEGKDADEKVHGCMEPAICTDDRENHQIAKDGEEVDEEEQNEKESLEVLKMRESHNDEFNNFGVVVAFHVSCGSLCVAIDLQDCRGHKSRTRQVIARMAKMQEDLLVFQTKLVLTIGTIREEP